MNIKEKRQLLLVIATPIVAITPTSGLAVSLILKVIRVAVWALSEHVRIGLVACLALPAEEPIVGTMVTARSVLSG